MKVLLIGSGTNLIEQVKYIKIKNYDMICGLNNVFDEKVKSLYERIGIEKNELNVYFISEYSYSTEFKDLVDKSNFKKIVYISPYQLWEKEHNMRRFMIDKSSNLFFIPKHIAKIANDLGEYGSERVGSDGKVYGPNQGWASTGMLALTYLIEYLNCSQVDLAGFTFFSPGKSIHHYENLLIDSKNHDTKNEKLIFDHFNRKKKAFLIDHH